MLMELGIREGDIVIYFVTHYLRLAKAIEFWLGIHREKKVENTEELNREVL
jgi:hypothetical protein